MSNSLSNFVTLHHKKLFFSCLASITITLSACGGGGSSDDSPEPASGKPPVEQPVEPPVEEPETPPAEEPETPPVEEPKESEQPQEPEEKPEEIAPPGLALYVADQDTESRYEIFSFDPASSRVSKLNRDLLECSGVLTGLAWMPDLSRILYTGSQDADGKIQLYQVKPDGSDRKRLNDDLVAGGDVAFFAPSPDGKYVAYIADKDTDGKNELYTVNLATGSHVKLNGTGIPKGGNVSHVVWSPDGSRVAYEVDQSVEGIKQIYSVNPDGSYRRRLNGNVEALEGGSVYEWAWSADGSRVVYLATEDTAGVHELYSVDAFGNNRVKLNGDLGSRGDVVRGGWSISPDGQRVLYQADQERDEQFEIYSVGISGEGRSKLNAAMPEGARVVQWQWSPDGSQVAYVSDHQTRGQFHLYSVSASGDNRVLLSPPLADQGAFQKISWSADGLHIVYSAELDTLGRFELFSSAADGSTFKQLSGNFVSGGSIAEENSWSISPNGRWVAYRATQNNRNRYELFVAPVDGSSPARRISGSLVAGGNVENFEWSANSMHLLYQADQDEAGKVELYLATRDGSSLSKVNGTLVGGGVAAATWVQPK